MKKRHKLNGRRIRKVLFISLGVLLVMFAGGEILVRTTVMRNSGGFLKTYRLKFDEVAEMYRGEPGAEGVFVGRNGIHGRFRINNEGWNSPRDYYSQRESGRIRIACVGRSNTEALRVEVADAYPNVLETILERRGIAAEVYTFGRDSTHLAQAVHVIRYIMRKYSPDIITIDAVEGHFLRSTASCHYVIRVEVNKNGDIEEIAPIRPAAESAIYWNFLLGEHRRLRRFIYRSKFMFFVNERFAVNTRTLNLLRMISAMTKGDEYVSHTSRARPHNLAMENSTEYRKNYESAHKYLLTQLRDVQDQYQVEIVFLLGPWYAASYNHPDSAERDPIHEGHRRYLKDLLGEFSLAYLDLTEAFAGDYRIHGNKFDFPHDGHLNKHGHQVEGAAVASYLIDNGIIAKFRDRPLP